MIIRLIEIRDRGTFIPAAAICVAPVNESQRYLARRAGFGPEGGHIILMRLSDQEAHADPHDWKKDTRTMPAAHKYVLQNFKSVADGDVIDVEFILGEKPSPKASEREDVAV